MCSDVVRYDLEGKLVDGGDVNDYVRSVQRTAYITVYSDYAYTQPIRCFIKYHHFLRVVTADPQDTLSSVVLVALKVIPRTCCDPSTLYELIIGTFILCVWTVSLSIRVNLCVGTSISEAS